MVCLQESKLSIINDTTIKSVWKIKDVGWLHLLAAGLAGGIVILWNKDSIECISTLISKTTVSCKFVIRLQRLEWYFAGVYCQASKKEHMALWKELDNYQDI